jgi:mannose/fructose/N-acetylgalactosamine-specific phosphotransferase system component IID
MVLAVLNKFALSGFRPDICTVSFIVSVIILFNIFNFSIRYYGIASGFEKGIESLKIFKTPGYFRIVRFLIVCRNILAAALIVNLIINAEAGNILLFFYD